MRGIVVSTPTYFAENGGFGTQAEFDTQLLRCWILYWDKLDFPRLRNGLIIETGIEAYLIRAGVFERSMIWPESSLKDGDLLTFPYFKAHEVQNRRQPGRWSLAIGEGALEVHHGSYATQPGLEIRLLKSLPIPDREVPFDDVLAFKARRRDELAQLWDAVDQICEQYLDDPQRPMAEHAAVRRFVQSAATAVALTRESGFPYRLASIGARYTAATALGAMLPLAFGGSLAEIVGNGALAAGSLFIGDAAGMNGWHYSTKPFAYLVSYDSEVFGPDN